MFEETLVRLLLFDLKGQKFRNNTGVNMGIEINLLPIKKGDCIHIRFEDETGAHNIIIDSGPASAGRKFRDLINKIRSTGETVDLLCFTHIDDDHIGGATKVLAESSFGFGIIKRAWLNCESTGEESSAQETAHTVTDMSVPTMLELHRNLLKHNIPVENDIVNGHEFIVGTMEIFVLTPLLVNHRKYQDYLKDKLEKISMSADDKSITNGDSISLLMCFKGKKYLFSGDIHADELTKAIAQTDKCRSLYSAQLPHHGSHRNLTDELLQQLNSTRLLISSYGNSDRPSEETIQILEKFQPNVKIMLLCNFSMCQTIKDNEHLKCINLQTENYSDTEGICFKSEA